MVGVVDCSSGFVVGGLIGGGGGKGERITVVGGSLGAWLWGLRNNRKYVVS